MEEEKWRPNLIRQIGSFEAATVHEAYGGKGSFPE
jgi:hypothetical protein